MDVISIFAQAWSIEAKVNMWIWGGSVLLSIFAWFLMRQVKQVDDHMKEIKNTIKSVPGIRSTCRRTSKKVEEHAHVLPRMQTEMALLNQKMNQQDKQIDEIKCSVDEIKVAVQSNHD